MPFRRRRPLARAAVIGGAGYYAGKRAQEAREADYERDARIAELEQQQVTQQQTAAPETVGSDDMIVQLEKLGRLKEQGILTEAEFEEQKRKLLAAS